MSGNTESPRLADGPYAVWRGQVFGYGVDRPGGTRISVLDGDPIPEGFEERRPGWHVRQVDAGAVEQVFSVDTYCAVDDEQYRLQSVQDNGQFLLSWTKGIPDRAAELGLVQYERGAPFVGAAPPEKVSEIWQQRHELGAIRQRVHELAQSPVAAGTPPAPRSTDDAVSVLRQVDNVIRTNLPARAEHVEIRFRAAGSHSELSWAVSDAAGTRLLWWPGPSVGATLIRLREAMYEENKGTWLSLYLAMSVSSISLHTANYTEEPAWRNPPKLADYLADLERFPRHAEHMPAWLRRHGPAQPNPRLRQARVFDEVQEGDVPVVNRPPVPDGEIEPVLDYLQNAPEFLVERGQQADLLDGAQDVPVAFHTDGAWIWPAEVAHYLRKHRIPPDPGLLDRIRARQFQLPKVDDVAVAEAEATITGGSVRLPPIGQRLETMERHALAILAKRLAEYGIPEWAYRVRSHVDGPICLERVEAGWQVARYDRGWPTDPVLFDRLSDAAAQLLGKLLIDPRRAGASGRDQG